MSKHLIASSFTVRIAFLAKVLKETKDKVAGKRCFSAGAWKGNIVMTGFIEVRTAIDSLEDAQKIAETVVKKRLAACVQISGPMTSTYWWQGKIEQAQEWLCTAKTRKDLYPELEQAIREVHTYDEPEILASEVVAGSQGYLDWLRRETEGQH